MAIKLETFKNETGFPNEVIAKTLVNLYKEVTVDGVFVARMTKEEYAEYNNEMPETAEETARRIISEYSADGSIESGLKTIGDIDPAYDAQETLGYMIVKKLHDKWRREEKQ